MRHLAYVGRRLVSLIPVGFGITLIVFFLIHLVPGDPAVTLLGTRATPEGVAALHKQFGLDQPLWQQYLSFLGRLLHGDLGTSFFYQTSVGELVCRPGRGDRLAAGHGDRDLAADQRPAGRAGGQPAGRRGRPGHPGRTAASGLGMPSFWLGIMLILLFALKVRLFPVAGFGDGFARPPPLASCCPA